MNNTVGTLGTKTYPKFGEATYDSSKSGVASQISGGFNTLITNLKGIAPVVGYEGVWENAFVELIALEAQMRAAATGKPLA